MGRFMNIALPFGWQAAGVFPAHKRISTGVHHRINNAQHRRFTIFNQPVNIDLKTINQLLGQHVMAVNISRTKMFNHIIERTHQAFDDVPFPGMKSEVRLEITKVFNTPGKHGICSFHRLRKKGKWQRDF